MEFWIIRNGQTFGEVDAIAEGQFDGQVTPLGIEQSVLTGLKMQEYRFDACYISDLKRSRVTLENVIKQNRFNIAYKIIFITNKYVLFLNFIGCNFLRSKSYFAKYTMLLCLIWL